MENEKIILEQVLPSEIEKRSFEIIGQELEQSGYVPRPYEDLVLKRVIHTTADFDYVENLIFSPGAAKAGIQALSQGGVIITDTQMAWSGINKTRLKELGGEAMCFMSDKEVAEAAKKTEPPGRLQAWRRPPPFWEKTGAGNHCGRQRAHCPDPSV